MRSVWWLAGGVGLGVGLMYWADPRSGRRRRARTHDKALHIVHEAEDGMRLVARDLVHRTRGYFFRTMGRVRHEEVDDKTLEARVRSALGRVCSHPNALRLSIRQGHVELGGAILAAEHKQVVARIARVRGVFHVTDMLEAYPRIGAHPDLQGGAPKPGERPEFLQSNWSPAARFVGALGGASLVTWGLWRSGGVGLTSSILGGLLALRGITNIELKRLTGVGGERLAIELHKDITVHAPVEEVFGFWRAMENFPLFMSHVEEVRTHGVDRSHWRVRGPAGTVFEWEAVITRLIPQQVLAWKSVEGSTVENTGTIHFDPVNGGRSTRLDIRLSYTPPAGVLGHVFARLLGADPKKQMDDDLLRFKTLVETGKAPGQPSRERLEPTVPERPGPRPVH